MGGGSNAIGVFTDFVRFPEVKLIGVEPAGRGLSTPDHGAVLNKGAPGIFFGARSYNMQTPEGQIEESLLKPAGRSKARRHERIPRLKLRASGTEKNVDVGLSR